MPSGDNLNVSSVNYPIAPAGKEWEDHASLHLTAGAASFWCHRSETSWSWHHWFLSWSKPKDLAEPLGPLWSSWGAAKLKEASEPKKYTWLYTEWQPKSTLSYLLVTYVGRAFKKATLTPSMYPCVGAPLPACLLPAFSLSTVHICFKVFPLVCIYIPAWTSFFLLLACVPNFCVDRPFCINPQSFTTSCKCHVHIFNFLYYPLCGVALAA